jgi:hypothetical protein
MNDDIDHREWEAQERERARANDTSESAGSDSRAIAYRRIARALREPAPVALPGDFAARVAARAATEQFSRFEKLLLFALITTLAALAAGIVMRFSGQWLLELRASVWPLAFAACVAVSWAINKPHRRAP